VKARLQRLRAEIGSDREAFEHLFVKRITDQAE
jgi:hypothetical protein